MEDKDKGKEEAYLKIRELIKTATARLTKALTHSMLLVGAIAPDLLAAGYTEKQVLEIIEIVVKAYGELEEKKWE